MKITANAHTHTTYCDGAHTAAEMAAGAFALGFTGLGFSGHSPAPFDERCPGICDEVAYRADIGALKKEYEGRMSILCGVEQDYYAPVNRRDYDYILGSVHYVMQDGEFVAVDGTPEEVEAVRDEVFGGDGIAMAKKFFETTVQNVEEYRPDIVGHFDVVTKHNQGGRLFDEDNAAYRNAALQALDAVANLVLPYGGIVEVNTGAFARGLRNVPYPAPFLLRHLAVRGVRVMINGDSHSVKALDGGFAEALEFVKAAGFTSVAMLRDGAFLDVPI